MNIQPTDCLKTVLDLPRVNSIVATTFMNITYHSSFSELASDDGLIKVDTMSEVINLCSIFTHTRHGCGSVRHLIVADIFKGSVIHQKAINSKDSAP